MSNSRIPRNLEPIRIRGVRHKQPDTRKIARAVIDLALREAAREAEALADAVVLSKNGAPLPPVQQPGGERRG